MNPYMAPMAQFPGQYYGGGYQPGTWTPPTASSAQQPIHGFVYVTGLEGAKAYPMPPNSEMPLFDSTGDILYIKTTDGAGFPTITTADCVRRDDGPAASRDDHVTKDELQRVYDDLSSQIERMRSGWNGTVSTGAPAGPGGAPGADAGDSQDDGRRP